MQTKNIIVALVAILLFVGALFFGVHLFLPGVTPTSSTTLPGQSGTGPDTTFPHTLPSATTTGQEAPPVIVNLDQEYANLSVKLSSQEITFTPTTGASAKAASVYALYSEDIALEKKTFPQKKDVPLDMAFIDLNNDGVEEVLVYENLASMCGSAGCPLDVYIKQGSSWQSVLSTVTGEHVSVLAQAGGGYRNLFILGYETKIIRWVWSGSAYQPLGTEATWNGSAFVIEQ